MKPPITARTLLAQEARALLSRLARIKPFSLIVPMTAAALPSPEALKEVERYLVRGRRDLRRMVARYIRWLASPSARGASPAEVQRRFVLLKLLFNKVLTQFDLFADVLIQRSEHENGAWLAGLDLTAADALDLKGGYYQAPPLLCYLDRGHGAAIRRARTRLPGGGENPVAIIRVPRERMVGSGIGASLIHEVGHQGAALLGLVDSVREELQKVQPGDPALGAVWPLWGRWISEILSDFWALAHLGIGSTRGLIGVVSLPRPFVFRTNFDDPHPTPWVRARLSCAMGRVLYPDPQWDHLDRLWERMYPLDGLEPDVQEFFRRVMATLPLAVKVLVQHRPPALRGRTLEEAFPVAERQPERLRALYRVWRSDPERMRNAAPTLVFAVLGQAQADRQITPEAESRTLVHLLNFWALRDTLDPTERRVDRRRPPVALAV
jgi:hypothetical protein